MLVNVAVSGGGALPVSEINDLQGELKTISPENKAKLRKEILETGFAFSPHVWRDPSDGKVYLLDGHQRVQVLRELIADGFTVPDVPVTYVRAGDVKEAKRRVLQASSQYGEVTAQGLFDFMQSADIALDDLKVSFDIPGVELKHFDNFFDGPVDDAPAAGETEQVERRSTEIPQEQFSHLIHTCPACGHRFGKGE